MAWWKDTAAVAGPAFAAVAAVASWAAVGQSRQVLKTGTRPNLQVQGVSMGRRAVADEEWVGQAIYVVHNAGGGLARGVAFLFVSGEEYAAGFIGLGFVRSGDTYNVRTRMRAPGPQPPMVGVVMCHDVYDRSYVWDLRGGRPRRIKIPSVESAPSLTDVFNEAYPDVDLGTLRQATAGIERATEPL